MSREQFTEALGHMKSSESVKGLYAIAKEHSDHAGSIVAAMVDHSKKVGVDVSALDVSGSYRELTLARRRSTSSPWCCSSTLC
jgi:hypothetical protein